MTMPDQANETITQVFAIQEHEYDEDEGQDDARRSFENGTEVKRRAAARSIAGEETHTRTTFDGLAVSAVGAVSPLGASSVALAEGSRHQGPRTVPSSVRCCTLR